MYKEGQQKQHAFEEEKDVNYNFQLRSKYLGSSGKWYSTFICQTTELNLVRHYRQTKNAHKLRQNKRSIILSCPAPGRNKSQQCNIDIYIYIYTHFDPTLLKEHRGCFLSSLFGFSTSNISLYDISHYNMKFMSFSKD
jgi:hypothetical protein